MTPSPIPPPLLSPPLPSFLPRLNPHDIQGRLLPPSPVSASYRLPLSHQTQVNDKTGRKVLRDRVLPSGNIYPDLLHYHHCQRRPNGWVHPRPFRLTFGVHVCHPPCCPAFSNRGFSTYVSEPNRITASTTATLNLPSVILSAPSPPKIFSSRLYLPCALQRFRSTTN